MHRTIACCIREQMAARPACPAGLILHGDTSLFSAWS
jgi:hypothetical protein